MFFLLARKFSLRSDRVNNVIRCADRVENPVKFFFVPFGILEELTRYFVERDLTLVLNNRNGSSVFSFRSIVFNGLVSSKTAPAMTVIPAIRLHESFKSYWMDPSSVLCALGKGASLALPPCI